MYIVEQGESELTRSLGFFFYCFAFCRITERTKDC